MVSGLVSLGNLHSPNTYIWLRVQVTGAGPTTLRAKAWKSGTAEPAAWHVTGTDTTAALQTVGTLGFRTYVSSSAVGATVFAFDDLTATAP